jgi:thiamine biosynthesis lipoprotein
MNKDKGLVLLHPSSFILHPLNMDRRQFLHPRRLAHTTGQVLGAVTDELPVALPAPSPAPEAALLRLSRQAMATTFELVLPVGAEHGIEIGEAVFELLDVLEEQLTVYRDTSEVSGLNRRAAREPVVVEEGLFELLRLAAQITEETEGAFDVTAGALIKAWGFFRGPRRVPSEAERAEALSRVGMGQVVLDAERRAVSYRREGLEINLGSIGKGYALDRLAAWLSGAARQGSFLLHGGASSVYARGTCGDERGWLVGVRHPWARGRRLACMWLRDRAVGTSAATFQHLVHKGRKLGHILDPRSGWPAEGMASTTVVAPTAARADALATAFFILGEEKARAYCEAHPDIGAVLLAERPGARPTVLGLRAEEIEMEGAGAGG